MAMAHQRTRGKVPRRTWPNLAATPLDQGEVGANGPSFEILACASVRECHPTELLGLNSSQVETRLAKSLLEPRIVAYCGEVFVRSRLLAERREQLA
jgi:hypothetical protein